MIPFFSYNQIQIGPITLYPWGFFIGLAFLVGYLLSLNQAKKQGIEEKKIFWLFIWIFIGIMVGSRLFYILQFPKRFLDNPIDIFKFSAGGLMLAGGLIGALILGGLYLKKAKLNFLKTADILAPAIALGIFIGRIGCFLINDHQGGITKLPWAIQWADGSLRHPIALYLSLNGLILFFVLWKLRKKLTKPGQLFFVFLIWYAISRFSLDFLRASDTVLADPHYWGLTISQWLGLGALTMLYFYNSKR